ncbi:hypothetical protein VP01_5551g1, partial [Puccinia sorghi]
EESSTPRIQSNQPRRRLLRIILNQAQCQRQLNLTRWKNSTESYTRLPSSPSHFSHRRIFLCGANLLDLLKIKDAVLSDKQSLSESEELILRTVLATKLDANIHSNVINHNNKENGKEIWKTNISLPLNPLIVLGAAIEKMYEVGINIDIDIIGYEIIKKFPKTPELSSISSVITHSGQEMTPDL